MPGGRFGCPDGKSNATTAAAASGLPVHRGYQPGDASHFLASAYAGPPHSSVGYRPPSVLHPPHYGDPQSGLMSYFSEAAAGLQSGFMGGDALSKQSNAADYSTSSSGEGKGEHSPSPSPFSLQQQQLQQQHLHQLHMIQQQQRLHQQQQQSQLQRQQILSNLNLSGLHQGGVSQERASSSSNQYCKPADESEGRTVSREVGRNFINNLTDSYHPRKRYLPNDEGNKNNAFNPQTLLESNLMQRIGHSVMSCAMKDLAQCASSSKTQEFSPSPMKVEDLTRSIPVLANSPSDDSKPCVLSGYREQNLTPTREDLMCHDLPLETTLHEGEEYHSSIDGDKGLHHNKLLSPSLGDDSISQGGRAKIYECSLCPFTCRKQTDLVSHVTIHPDEKPFHCKQCDYKGAKYHYLRNHLLTHSQRPLLSCTECEYKCYQNGALRVHMRRHSDEKRYACTTCHYRTHFMGNLKLHLRVHTGEKPYACSVCDFRCTQSGSLKIHMRGHSGEKPYGCDMCEYRSKHKGNLVMHRRKHTGDKPYHCDQCNYKAAQRMALTKHKKTVHGLAPSPLSVHKAPDTPSDLSVILHQKVDHGFIGPGPMPNDSSNSPEPSEHETPLHPKHELLEQPSISPVSTPSLRYPYYDQNFTERKPLLHHFQEPWKLNNFKQSEKIAEDEQRYKGDEQDPLYVCGDLQNKHCEELQNDTDSSER